MARPLKEGIDYFSLDCYMDDKVKMIQAEFGLKGFAIIVKLWQIIYREHGYYCEWNKERELLFASEEGTDCSTNLIHEVVQACIRRDIFSKELFEKYQILTSRGVQKRYLSATAKRKKTEVKKEYSLVEVADNRINYGINSVNDGRNQVNEVDNTQSKVKESKVNNNALAHPPSDSLDDGDDDGMEPMEAMRIWKDLQKRKS